MTSTASTPWHSLKSSLWPRLIVLSLDILLATPFLTERARVRLAKSRAKRQALLLYLQMNGALVPLKTGDERDTVVLLVHEMSRTGAPILAWNILRELHRHNLNVVVIALGDGQIEPYFRRDSDLLLLFPFLQMIDARNRARIAHGIINAYKPAYCIANSVGTSSLAHELAIAGLPIVGLVHEFSSYAHHYIPNIVETLESLHIAVFPAEIVRQSAYEYFPFLRQKETQILAQGPSMIPRKDSAADTSRIASLRGDADFVVLGAGSVEWRKGTDLFVATAAAIHRKAPQLKVRFVWVGGTQRDKSEIRVLLGEQIARSDVATLVTFVDTTEELEAYYANADAFFLSSRLDPLPNVCIDAAMRGLPIVCFANASGAAEILERNDVCRELIAPYADPAAAAEIILRLATDSAWRNAQSRALAETASEQFNMSNYVGKIVDLGRKLVEKMRPPQ